MTKGIRGRILTWLLIAIMPLLAVGITSASIVEDRISDRLVGELTNSLRQEAARISQDLAGSQVDADRLARSTFVRIFTEQVQAADEIVEGQGGFNAVDPNDEAPLNQVATAIRDASLGAGTAVLEARVVGLDGRALGQSSGYIWEPDAALVEAVLDDGHARYGPAFRVAPGDLRVGLVTPITNPEGGVVGLLVSEVGMNRVVELLQVHEEFGRSSEAFLVQPGIDGRAEYISSLRFVDDAFGRLGPADPGAPVNLSLETPMPTVVEGRDYRGVESVYGIAMIEETGWGLVLRVDADEAFGISKSIRTLVLVGSSLAVVALLFGWAVLLRPLVARIRNTAAASDRVAAGDYTSRIGDRTPDEVGEVARAIDRLAADLEEDIRMRNDAEQRLRYQATHDELTNIYNRQHMTSLIRDILATPENDSVSLLFLDLDDFKLVNDLWGHAIGDEVLAAVATRLRGLTEDDALVARWGGDEFTVVLKNADAARTTAFTHRVRSLFTHPIDTSVGPHHIACSVGVATAVGGDQLDTLLHDADARMFEEKQANRTLRMVDPDTARLVENALSDGRLEVHYQPIVHLLSPTEGRIQAVEALVRIRAENGTLHLPDEFLDEVLSHRYGREIDRTIAAMAMRDLVDWRHRGLVNDTFRLHLNLSPASMRDPGLAESLGSAATGTGVDPSIVVLELSDEGEAVATESARQLARFGFGLAVDDLGMRRSNFDRLLAGNVRAAKLDRRWLADPVVLASLIGPCAENGIDVVAEGIEEMHELATMFAHGVRLCQGFVISRPRAAADMVRLLATVNAPAATAPRAAETAAAGSSVGESGGRVSGQDARHV